MPQREHRHFLTLTGLPEGVLEQLLTRGAAFAEQIATPESRPDPPRAPKTVVNLMYEESTRTRVSFAHAAQRLGHRVIDIASSTSSAVKGESLLDTGRTVAAMGVNAVVLRHSAAGSAELLARHCPCSIVNAGDGIHAHPTQALLDLLTLQRHGMQLTPATSTRERTVGIVGDIANSRVARSLVAGLVMVGTPIVLIGPRTLVPSGLPAALKALRPDAQVRVSHELDAVLPELDVIYLLRVQRERKSARSLPSLGEYHALYGMHTERLSRCKPNVAIMHPGPTNVGVEITQAVADSPRALIRDQVSTGVAARMAVLEWVLGS